MASSVAPASTTVFTSLAPRPPTPPRETTHEIGVSRKSILGRAGPSDPRTSLHTPPSANTPVSNDSNSKSTRSRKKVVWSAHTEYQDPVDYRKSERLHKSSPLSAPSPASSKPIKGILKPSPSPNPLISALNAAFDGPAGQGNIIEMLDSTIKQLAGSDRDSKLDAYMMLARALKASNNLPDRVALQNKMSLFMQFIQRDVTSKGQNGTLDTSLINHALTLLATFLHFPAIASTLTSDFGVFIIDHSIRSFEDASIPKDVVRHLMQVVAFQNFPAKVMTSDRVGRLITALHQIEDHLKGKSIVMSRLHIYSRLVKQARNHMATHSNWLKDMFTDMLSTIKDIRAQAVGLATEAGFSLRSEKHFMRKASEVFQTTSEDQTYIEFYIHRLQEMLKDKQTSVAVPQIWSAVVLYMRCPLERWQYYGPWLTLVQSAFNMTDGSTKQEANYAWNRYVYLTLTDSKTSPKALGTLCQPLTSQLRRKANPKQLEDAVKLRRVVIGGICNLYYYAFAPDGNKYSPDVVWDVAVQPIMAQLISLDGKPEFAGDFMMQASRMLTGLLDVATPRVWRQDRITETPPVKPDELPPIESKWVRRNCDKIFQAVGPILEKKFTDLANKETLVFRLWQAMVGSVAAASAKDIKVSEDTAKFFACVFGLLSNIWTAGSRANDGSDNPKLLSSVKNFIGILVDALGILPFTEKKLSMTVANTFEHIATPSHHPDRSDKSRGVVRTPLHHLFSMLRSVPPGAADDDALSDLFLFIFEPFFSGKTSKGRVELAQELLQLLPRNSPSSYGPWLLASHNLSLSLESDGYGSAPSSADSNKILGPKYREIASLLERGLTAHPNLPSDHWLSLLERLSEHVSKEFGDAGRALIVVQPLAKVLLDGFGSSTEKPFATALKAAQALFEVAKLPRDRAALDVARRRLWGTPLTAVRGGTSDPFDNLYEVGNQVLELLYNKISDFDSSSEIAPFVEAVEGFLTRCFSQAGIKTLAKLQKGLCLWIRDEKSHFDLGDESSISKTASETRKCTKAPINLLQLRHVWDRISTELAGRGQLSKDEFDQIEPLLTAAFQSKHLYIVSKAVETWNILAKDEESLECSDSLKSVVSGLGSKVERLTSGTEQSSGEFGAQASSFLRPQEDVSIILSSTSSHQAAQQPGPSSAVSVSTTASRRPMTRKRRMEATPEVARAKLAKRTSTPRLRHDDSQIQFAPIASSPPPNDESQHLTERQREIRERQKENAALYSDLQTSSLTQSSPEQAKEPAVGDAERARDKTPPRPTSYEDLISSTPTPRRGQVLQMDDNDPPSSPPMPPMPRPYPLLSEIQSRSKASSSLDWEFSSPPVSPAASHRRAALDVELFSRELTNDAENAETSKRTMTKRPDEAASSSELSEQEESSDIDMSDLNQQEPPSTPSRQPRASAVAVRKSPKSGDDEFVDARSSPVEPSSLAQELLSDSNDTSFALSEGDESFMMKFVVELESRRFHLNESSIDACPNTTNEESKQARECIMVQGEKSPCPSPPQASKRAASPVIPSTPAEATEDVAESEPRRKRKRSVPKVNGDRAKKRRSESDGDAEKNETPAQVRETSPSPAACPRRSARQSTGVETRGSARKRRQERRLEEAEVSRKRTSKRNKRRQSGDTDDEVMSQLVTESNAASQSQSQPEADGEEEVEAAVSMDATVAGEADIEPRADGESIRKPLTIMEALQGGLKQLRKAALSRDEVYKMEDVLMDMKRELFEAERRGRRKQQ